ncbi:MAG: hypothetical protein ACK55I_00380, partial [bacterium]
PLGARDLGRGASVGGPAGAVGWDVSCHHAVAKPPAFRGGWARYLTFAEMLAATTGWSTLGPRDVALFSLLW